MQKNIIGIQGGSGSYHEIVAKQYFDDKVPLEYLRTFKQVFEKLISGEITHAVMAIANNRYGFIPESFSLLMQYNKEITIIGEAYLSVKHQLLALEGSRLEDITEVHSQAPALGQCMQFLQKNLPNAVIVEEADTAISAQIVKDSSKQNKAAIASLAAAKLSGLEVIASDIQDDPNNITRFYVLQKNDALLRLENANKTTALLSTSQNPGSLVDALTPFKEQGINISTLHSSFLPNTDFEMQFLIEFDAGIHDNRTKIIIKTLEDLGASLQSLGSYHDASD